MSNHLRQGSLLEVSAPPLASRASEAMRVGDFKQAIDLFKRLVKQDARTEWRDGLAEAYARRARTLAAKGMFEEAETALSKTAGPTGRSGIRCSTCGAWSNAAKCRRRLSLR
jgi:tetratricopeptide (TPR) repeat protein